MKNLNKVTISSGVKGIGQDAFYNCESLHEIIIPESVEYIDGGAVADGPFTVAFGDSTLAYSTVD